MSVSLDGLLPVAAGGDGLADPGEVEFRAVFPAVPEAVPAVRGYVWAVAGDCGARRVRWS